MLPPDKGSFIERTTVEKVRYFFRRRRRLLAAGIGGLVGIATLIGSVWVYREFGLTAAEEDLPYVPALAWTIISLLVGGITYEVIDEGSLAHESRLNYQSIIAGLVFYGVIGQIWIELFYGKWNDFFIVILEFATAALAFFLFKKWRDRRLEDL